MAAMNHTEATRCLLDVVPDPCGDPVARDLAAHLDACDECRSWHASLELLAASVQPPALDDHPASDVIALCAARPDEVLEPDRADLRRHLEICGECRREIGLMRDALEHARVPKAERPMGWNRVHARPGRLWTALAATAVVSISLAALLSGGFGSGSDPGPLVPQSHEPRAGTDERSAVTATDSSSLGDVSGQQEIQVGSNETLVHTKITDGSRVTIRGDQRLAFGDGFVIGSGTRVVVGTNAEDRGNAGRSLRKQYRTAG